MTGVAGPALHLVRHGESTWNVAGLVQGQTDEAELTQLGRRQAAAAAKVLAALEPVRLLASDLRRASTTAQIIGAATGLTPIRTSLLREQSVGRLEGLTSTQARVQWEIEAAAAVDEYGDPMPLADLRVGGGESIRDVLARVAALLASPLVTDAGGDVVIVTHGDTIRILLGHLLGDDPDEPVWRDVGNAEVHSVLRDPDGGVVHRRAVVSASAPQR